MKGRGRSAEDGLRAIVDKSPDGIVILDDDGRVGFANPAACALFGFDRKTLLGSNLGIPIVAGEVTEVDIVTEAGEPGVAELRVVELEWDGRPARLASLRNVTLYKRAEETLRQHGAELEQAVAERTRDMRREIVERERARKALSGSEERLRTLLRHLHDIILILDARGMIWYQTHPAEAILGYPPYGLLGKNLVGLVHPEDADGVRAWFAGLLKEQGHPFEHEFRFRKADGSWLHLGGAGQNLLGTNHIGGVVITARDVTERKRAEEKLLQALRDMEEANKEVQRFAYIVSHDLRSPLTSIKGFTQMSQASLAAFRSFTAVPAAEIDPERWQAMRKFLTVDLPEALGFILAGCTQMDRLTGAVLQLSRMGRREFSVEPVDIRTIVEEHLQSLAFQLDERGVTVKVGDLPTVVADRLALHQIFGNLLSNAVKYLSRERPGVIEVTANGADGHLVFQVRDNGRGIADHDIPKVFEIFQRLGETEIPGEGMGLAYVQTLVRRIGGHIWCESELGKGSTFCFSVPHRVAPATETGSHSAA